MGDATKPSTLATALPMSPPFLPKLEFQQSNYSL